MQYRELISVIDKTKEEISFQGANVVSRLSKLFGTLNKELQYKKINTSLSEEVCKNLVDIVKASLSGKRNEAFKLLYDTYFEGENISRLNIVNYEAEEKKRKSFYRIRNSQEYVQYGRDEMYHIPFEKNHLVGNERFSTTGVPTLYLSSSIYGCWEETGRGNLDYANVVLFKNTQKISLINLTNPPENLLVCNDNVLLAFLLLLSTSLKVARPKEKFIPEYIIPQLLMECLIAYRSKMPDLLGIEYKSVHQNKRDLMFTEEDKSDLFTNYAIPPYEYQLEGICPTLKKIFEYWESTSWARLQYKRPNAFTNINENGQYWYDVSRFGLMERYLNLRDPKMLTYSTKRIGDIPAGALTL